MRSFLDAFVSSQCIGNKVLTFLFLGCELVMTNRGRGSACGWVQAAKSCSLSPCTSQPVLLSMTTGQLNRPPRADVKGQGFGHRIITATKIASPPTPSFPHTPAESWLINVFFFSILGWETKPTCISWNVWQSLAASHQS